MHAILTTHTTTTTHKNASFYRHGHSKANEADVIISSLDAGQSPQWGLTDLGRQQADAAGESLVAAMGHFDASKLQIFTSPFSRAVETALQAASHLEVSFKDPRLKKVPELCERYFGTVYEGKSTAHYADVWADDAKNPATKPPGGGESVDEVAARMRELIQALEQRSSTHGFNFLIVSHGDALSVLAAVLLGTDLREHRAHGLGNCDWIRIPKKDKEVENGDSILN